jgi:hypothetical protein
VVDHRPPAIEFLWRLQVDIEGYWVVGQKTANGPKPFALRKICARDDQKINIALIGRIATRIASEKNDLLGVEVADYAAKCIAKV